jgi:hypothetical protein
MFFTQSSKDIEPNFGNYALGASLAVNVNRYIGLEAEGGGTVGVRQNLTVGSLRLTDQKTPGMWTYNGNIVFNPYGSNRSIVPYATAGMGGLTMVPSDNTIGVTARETFLTGNVGVGVKWFSTRHIGIRGDYRLFVVKGKDTAPAFFGVENRYGHRVQAGLIFTY